MNINKKTYLTNFFLRYSLAIVFLYSAISSFLQPTSWIGFIPNFITYFLPKTIFLHIHEILNLVLAIWLISSKRIYYAAIISAASIFSIIVFNLGALDIIFRDIAIFFAAIALAIHSYGEE
jgi:hypothetical protein